jgi:hypothetical protein
VLLRIFRLPGTTGTVRFSQKQQEESFQKQKTVKLVVVMSAVDWWKNERAPNRLRFLRPGVRWNFLRRFGKGGKNFDSSYFSIFFPHFTRIFTTDCAHILHTDSLASAFAGKKFFHGMWSRGESFLALPKPDIDD